MSRLSNLLRQVEQKDQQLAADLAREVRALGQRRQFGLNFERHIPETVELYGRPVRKGDKVRFLAPRNEPQQPVDRSLWKVADITRRDGQRLARLLSVEPTEARSEPVERAVQDLVVVAEFRDPIYPGLVSTGKVKRGGDKPYHAVINAENFHALQLLLYTHEGKVDAIYIDPPYNTGARDWKYNNDYVDADDVYRHSKWLAFIERRLKLARRLLDPDDSVLVVTIDEKEVNRLGVLLEQMLPDATIQLVTIVNNPKGVTRSTLSRVEEYAFFCFFGTARAFSIDDDLLTPGADAAPAGSEIRPRWKGLLRSGSNAAREQHPTFFYPVLVDPDTRRIIGAGESPPPDVDPDPDERIDGCLAIWPVRKDGSWGRWMLKPRTLVSWAGQGYVAVGQPDPKRRTWGLSYLTSEPQAQIAAGVLEVRAVDEATGVADVVYADVASASRRPKTVWHRTSHDAGVGGTAILGSLIPRRRFDYAKSVYAVRDVLAVLTQGKANAVVLDFFAGSGTTAHALMLLNLSDGGSRRSISVTNNEVTSDEQSGLAKRGLRPGDPDWEALGICEWITKPRITAAVTGLEPGGDPVKGDYKFVDEFPMAEGFQENVEFFTMTYEAPRAVAHHRSFEAVAPLLWLKAGATGRRIEQPADDFALADAYAILFDPDCSRDFLAALPEADTLRTVFIVTDDDRAFQMVCRELPAGVETVRLYSSYLTNFTINTGRE